MNRINKIPVKDGSYLYLSPICNANVTPTGYFLGIHDKCLAINTDQHGLISVDQAQQIIENNIGSNKESLVFSKPELVEAIFNWDIGIETDVLKNLLKEYGGKTILDMGCGTGRLSTALVQSDKGLKIIAIDNSVDLINFFGQKIKTEGLNIQTICGDICDVSFPSQIDFSFSALNTIRYLGSLHRVKKHISYLGDSTKKGGIYAFHCSVSPNRNAKYKNQWIFSYNNQDHIASWENYSFSYNNDIIIDKVQILDSSLNLLYEEFQAQVYLSWEAIENILFENKNVWKLIKILDTRGTKISDVSKDLEGSFWFVLQKI